MRTSKPVNCAFGESANECCSLFIGYVSECELLLGRDRQILDMEMIHAIFYII